VAVIGGGPAGSAAAITAARAGMRVLQLERGALPRQRVCGEFVSAESLNLLHALLGNDDLLRQAQPIPKTRLFVDGETISASVTPSAASVARWQLDAALWNAALSASADCRQDVPVESVERNGSFAIKTREAVFHAGAVINAAGRWSNLNKPTSASGERRLGMKAHFRETDPPHSADLYFFRQGYCGVQPVGDNAVNVCAMVKAGAARSLPEVFALHPELWRRSRDWQEMFEPVNTFPLVFRKPEPVRAGVFQVGDAAGFIDPFVGDGISLALRSGVMAAECLIASSSLTLALARYGAFYRAKLSPPFRAASRIRGLFAMPRPLRKITAKAIQWMGAAESLMAMTR